MISVPYSDYSGFWAIHTPHPPNRPSTMGTSSHRRIYPLVTSSLGSDVLQTPQLLAGTCFQSEYQYRRTSRTERFPSMRHEYRPCRKSENSSILTENGLRSAFGISASTLADTFFKSCKIKRPIVFAVSPLRN